MPYFLSFFVRVFAWGCALVMALNVSPVIGLSASRPFRIMTYNIHHGVGVDGVLDTERIASVIALSNADLVGLQEVDVGTTRVGGRDLAREVAELTGMNHVFYGRPYQGGKFGNAILSRFPIKSSEDCILPRIGGLEERRGVRVTVMIEGRDFSFSTTHLAHLTEDEPERLKCAELFNQWLGEERAPAVICGDFNDFPNGAVHLLMKQSWKDVWEELESGNGFTFPSQVPNRRIDFHFAGKNSPIELIKTWVVTEAGVVSDHLPLMAEMRLLAVPDQGFNFGFDEGSGTSATDTIQGIAGTIVSQGSGWITNTPSGQVDDSALFFNGSSRVSVPDPNGAVKLSTNHGDYTLEAWVKLPLNYVPFSRMMLFQYEGDPGFSLSIAPGRFLQTTTFGKSDLVSAAMVPNDGQWHHVAAVHHDSSRFEFFIEGVLASTIAYTNGPGLRTNPIITIGALPNQANAYFGSLDRIRFTPWALAAAQLDCKPWPREKVPFLKMQRTESNQILFRWPAIAPFSLESSNELTSTDWTTMEKVVDGTECQATVIIGEGNRFYRLQRDSN